jgi:hypothetical protein
MNHFYRDVPKLGHVAFSRHAQERLEDEGVSEETVRSILYDTTQPDIPDGQGVVHREGQGIRLVILMNPTPNRGARLVKTAYRIQANHKATRY